MTLTEFFSSIPFQNLIFSLKIVFLAVSAFFFLFTIFLLFKTQWLRYILLEDIAEFLTYKPYGLKKVTRPWAKIMARLETGLEEEFKLAVIQADSMLNETLKKMGYRGETLKDRLDQLTLATLPNIDQIFEAHQIRNKIVHDPDYRLTLDEARRVLRIYEQAFRDLGAF